MWFFSVRYALTICDLSLLSSCVCLCIFDERTNERFPLDYLLKRRVRFIISQWHFDARQSMKVAKQLRQQQQRGAVDWFK